MEEIGCHFKFEKIIGNIYHDTNLLLSSGRNCLKYIINERNITTLFLPYFLCESLSEVAISENVDETLTKIERILSEYQVDIKQMKKLNEVDSENDSTVLKIIGQYNKKGFNKNLLLKNISLIENVAEVIEE